MPRTLLTDELWSKLLIILLELGLYDKSNLRRTIEGILYRMRTGCPWRDLPASFGKFQAVYNCFNRWSKKGIIQGIFKKLSTDTDKVGVCTAKTEVELKLKIKIDKQSPNRKVKFLRKFTHKKL